MSSMAIEGRVLGMGDNTARVEFDGLVDPPEITEPAPDPYGPRGVARIVGEGVARSRQGSLKILFVRPARAGVQWPTEKRHTLGTCGSTILFLVTRPAVARGTARAVQGDREDKCGPAAASTFHQHFHETPRKDGRHKQIPVTTQKA